MAFGIRPVRVPIVGVDQFSKTFGKIGKNLSRSGEKIAQVGSSMTRKVTLPIMLAGAAILATAGSFEASMKEVQVLTTTSGAAFTKLSDRAREMGANTQFSASEAAKAMTFLAMAGLSADQTFTALPGTLQLAAAAGTDLATAADLATNIMTPFGYGAERLTEINDVLANTFTRTNTNMLQLGEAMKYVAPVANAMHISLNETAAAIGLMGNAGIQASMAGTSLRGVLSKLATPSREAIRVLSKLRIRKQDVLDSRGNVKSIIDVVRALEKSGASAGDMLEIFGERAGPGMAALVQQGSGALADLTEKTKITGKAAEIAKIRQEGLFGQLKRLRSAAEELAISMGEAGLLEAATKLAMKLIALTQRFQKLSPETKRWLMITAGILAILGPILLVVGKFIASLGFIFIGVAKLAPVFLFLLKIFGWLLTGFKFLFVAFRIFMGLSKLALLNPVTLIIAALFIWIYVIKQIADNWEALTSAFESKMTFFKTFKFFLAEIAEALADMFSKIPLLGKGLSEHFRLAAEGFRMEGAETGAATAGAATVGSVNTNNAHVLVEVQSKDGSPVRAKRESGADVSLKTDTGLMWAPGL